MVNSVWLSLLKLTIRGGGFYKLLLMKLCSANYHVVSQNGHWVNTKVTAPSFKPEIRLRAKQPSSERMTQSDERKILK